MVVHIVGQPIRLGKRVRQRCSWCGELLVDLDLGTVVERWVPIEPGELAGIEGKNQLKVVEHANGAALPEGACITVPSLGDRALAMLAKLGEFGCPLGDCPGCGEGGPPHNEGCEWKAIFDAIKACG